MTIWKSGNLGEKEVIATTKKKKNSFGNWKIQKLKPWKSEGFQNQKNGNLENNKMTNLEMGKLSIWEI